MNEQLGEDLRVDACEGKYTYVMYHDGRAKALRHGKEWIDVQGDNLILALASDLDVARKDIKELQAMIEQAEVA